MRNAGRHVEPRGHGSARAHAGRCPRCLPAPLMLGALDSVPTLAADPRQAAEQVAREQGACRRTSRSSTSAGDCGGRGDPDWASSTSTADRRDPLRLQHGGVSRRADGDPAERQEAGAAQLTMLQRKADAPLRARYIGTAPGNHAAGRVWTRRPIQDRGGRGHARSSRGDMARRPPADRDSRAGPRLPRRAVEARARRVRGRGRSASRRDRSRWAGPSATRAPPLRWCSSTCRRPAWKLWPRDPR